jgi:hypothetical protein
MSIETIRKQAKDENSPPELLGELAKSKDYMTRQYVIANPNTPTATLLNLGAEFPRELLNNPIFDLLLLENPNLISDIPIATLRSLIKQDNVPKSFIVECAERESDKELLLAMTMNSQISSNILEKLIKSKFTEVAEAADLHVSWSGEISEGWKEIATQKVINISNRAIDDISICQMTTLIITNLIPQDFLNYFNQTRVGKYIFDEIKRVNKKPRPIIDKNSGTHSSSPQVLEKELDRVLATITDNPYSWSGIQEKLATLARNIDTPSYILEKIFEYRKCFLSNIGLFIAAHPNTPVHILEGMIESKYGCYDVLYLDGLIENPNLPINLWKKLIENPENKKMNCFKILSCFCKQHPDRISLIVEDYTRSPSHFIRLIALLYLPDFPDIEILNLMASSIDWIDRYVVAQNSNTPLKIIQQLTNDGNKIVLAAAKENLESKQKS